MNELSHTPASGDDRSAPRGVPRSRCDLTIRTIGVLALVLWTAAAASFGQTDEEPAGVAEADEAVEASARAEDRAGQQIEEQIDVRAERPPLDDLAAFATVVDVPRHEGRALDLGDLLRRVPGARIHDYGGLGRFATVSLRGSTAEQVTVLVDGVPQNRALGGPVDLSPIPLGHLERVTVFRGLAPAAAGLSGIGGLIDIRTREPDDVPTARFDLSAGSLSTQRFAASWNAKPARGPALLLTAELFASDGDFTYLDTNSTPLVSTDDARKTRVNNDVTTRHVLARARGDELTHGRLELSARVLDRDRGIPGVDGLAAQAARLEEGRGDVQLTWMPRIGGKWDTLSLTVDGLVRRDELRDPLGEVGIGVQDQTTDVRGGGLATLGRLVLADHRLLARVELRHERVRVEDRALTLADRGGASRSTASLTVEDLFSMGRVSFAPAARLERREDRFTAVSAGRLPPPTDDVSETRLTGKLGLAVALGGSWTLRGSAGRFHRAPGLMELFGDRGTIAGNPRLTPERGLNAELGVSGSLVFAREWHADVELVAFGSRVEDMILWWPRGGSTVVPSNLDKARLVGLEAWLRIQGPGRLAIEASATVQDTEDISGGFPDGQPLPGRPEREGFVGVHWLPRGWDLRWELTYVGENPTDRFDTPALRLPARVLHDARIGCIVHQSARGELELGLEALNVFDRETRDVARFPLPGRMLFLELAWRLGGER
ncbi:MAG: TonB-dependent receptor [Acidobacteriota bacterium]|nr:MAG: TonB-dependent receptor [Acidobacteriota bacterium]